MQKINYDRTENIFGTPMLFRQNMGRLVGSKVRIQTDGGDVKEHVIEGINPAGFVVDHVYEDGNKGSITIGFPNPSQYVGRYDGYDVHGWVGDSAETAVMSVTSYRFAR